MQQFFETAAIHNLKMEYHTSNSNKEPIHYKNVGSKTSIIEIDLARLSQFINNENNGHIISNHQNKQSINDDKINNEEIQSNIDIVYHD